MLCLIPAILALIHFTAAVPSTRTSTGPTCYFIPSRARYAFWLLLPVVWDPGHWFRWRRLRVSYGKWAPLLHVAFDRRRRFAHTTRHYFANLGQTQPSGAGIRYRRQPDPGYCGRTASPAASRNWRAGFLHHARRRDISHRGVSLLNSTCTGRKRSVRGQPGLGSSTPLSRFKLHCVTPAGWLNDFTTTAGR